MASIEAEVRAAADMAAYEAVDVLWLALLKLANRFSGTKEHHRMLALVDTITVEEIQAVLRLPAVDSLLNLRPPLETILSDPHEQLEEDAAKKSLDTLRRCRDADPRSALLALGGILKRIRNRRAHGFKSRSGPRDSEILGAARSVLAALCSAALDSAKRRDA
ncbi:MAG: hypothetical protein ACT4PO_14500 [Actinomycetota bacterium]